MRGSRYIGLSATHLQNIATVAANNVVRVVTWLAGEMPEATRLLPIEALALA